MSEHLLPTQIERYRQRRLAAADRQTIDEHIGSCDACRALLNEKLGDLETLEAALQADWTDMLADVGEQTPHLSYETVADCAERQPGRASSREIEDHLRACAACEERVASLRAFRDETEAAPSVEEQIPSPRLSFWERIPRLPPD